MTHSIPLQLPVQFEILTEIVLISIKETGGSLSCSLVCQQMRKATNDAIRKLWKDLKIHSLLESTFKETMVCLEIASDPSMPCVQLFRELTRQITIQYQINYNSRFVPVLSMQFANMFRELENKNLKKIWDKIHSQQPDSFPDLSSSTDVRLFCNNPKNHPKWDEIVKIAFSNSNLCVFPNELSLLTNVTKLDLSDNGIKEIPHFPTLPQLKKLKLTNNKLTKVPALGGSPLLQDLYLNNNRISIITGLTLLSGLQELFMEDNKVTDISCLSVLTNLQVLNVNKNLLTDISNIGRLPELRWLYLKENQLTKICPLGNFSQLTCLHLTGNLIKNLPEIGVLTRLRDLHINNNQIELFPDLTTLSRLEFLYLSGNPCKTLPNMPQWVFPQDTPNRQDILRSAFWKR